MKNKGWIIALAVVAVVVMVFAGGYNSLVSAREAVNAQWANVENQYQRRADLIPNLVATVKGYAAHEDSVFTQIADSRARLGGTVSVNVTEDPEAFENFQKAQGELTASLGRLLALQENYPALKANENFMDLQSQLEGTENRIATERRRYNDLARSYNEGRLRFPRVMIANMFGFKEKAYFTADESAREVPKVQF